METEPFAGLLYLCVGGYRDRCDHGSPLILLSFHYHLSIAVDYRLLCMQRNYFLLQFPAQNNISSTKSQINLQL